jgi:hypothetical protein
MNTLKKIVKCLLITVKQQTEETEEKNDTPFNYISVQSKIEEMSKVNESIKELDRFITDLQMYKKNQHEGNITIKYNDMQGKEKDVNFWIDGDFSGDSFSADILQDLYNERDRRRERLCELMNSPSPTD